VAELAPYRGPSADGWEIDPAALAVVGGRAVTLSTGVDAWIAAADRAPEWALVDIGINDLSAPATSEADYKTQLAYTLDAIHAAWPSCKALVSKIWGRGFDAQADTMAGWIDSVLATRSPWAAVGDDERVWMKGSDNGATMSSDGIHYSSAGNTEKAIRVRVAMGY